MAQFWGWVRGGRTSVSRTGGVDSGLDVVASGRSGVLHVHLEMDDRTGREVYMIRHTLKQDGDSIERGEQGTPLVWGYLDVVRRLITEDDCKALAERHSNLNQEVFIEDLKNLLYPK